MMTTRELQDEIIRLKKENDICRFHRRLIWTQQAGCHSTTEECAHVRCPLHGRDLQDFIS